MKEMYRTAEGALTAKVDKVYVSDDGEVYNSRELAVFKDKYKTNPKGFPNSFKFMDEEFKYPSLNPYEGVLTYSSGSDVQIEFNIQEDGDFVFSQFYTWLRCRETDVYSNPKYTDEYFKDVKLASFVKGDFKTEIDRDRFFMVECFIPQSQW